MTDVSRRTMLDTRHMDRPARVGLIDESETTGNRYPPALPTGPPGSVMRQGSRSSARR
jgi:hypothetical protein